MHTVVGAYLRDAPLKEIRRLRKIVQTERNETCFLIAEVQPILFKGRISAICAYYDYTDYKGQKKLNI